MVTNRVNDKINSILIIVAALLFLVPAIICMLNNHYDSMYLVVEKKIVEAAESCSAKDECISSTVTLEELIDKGYLNKVYNPVTKELINDKSYVDLNNKEFKVVE
jgi:hypothetical protein